MFTVNLVFFIMGSVVSVGLGALCVRLSYRLNAAEARASKNEGVSRTLEKDKEEMRFRNDQAQQEIKEMNHHITALTSKVAKYEAEYNLNTKQIKHLEELQGIFKKSASEAISGNTEHFLKLSREYFEQTRQLQNAEMSKAQQSMDEQLKPVKETLVQYQKHLEQFDERSRKALGDVSKEIQVVAQLNERIRDETNKLSTSLRAESKTRGCWGEYQLKNVLELAGMMEHVDFETQSHGVTETGKNLRPDVVIRMPGGRQLVVDVKTNLNAYMDAMSATTEEDRRRYLSKHLTDIRKTINDLASKEYWRSFESITDMVVMFIPGDHFYAAAVEQDPTLFGYALEKDRRVLIATPSTMFAIAKSVAYGWQQAAISQDAHNAVKIVRKAYEQMVTTGKQLADLGKGINSVVNKYNGYVGSLERRALPYIRSVKDLKGVGDVGELGEIKLLEDGVQQLSGKDLDLVGYTPRDDVTND